MEAHSTLSQRSLPGKSPIGKSGVLMIGGFGMSVRVQRGHLEIHYGVGTDRHTIKLPRIGHGLKRLVVIGSDGVISLAAIEWLRDQDASFVMLERNGKVLCVTGPVRPSEAKLRRAQALSASNGVGLQIARTLIDAKLKGQERVLCERLNRQSAAAAISDFRRKLGTAETFDAIRIIEANAAASYFREWHDIPVTWPTADLRKIPHHWRFAGSRQSPLTGGPRLAVTPVHAVLNYCFALLQAETTLCLSALGLDAGLGIGLHTDIANRDSLSLDVLEPIRPEIEAWLLNWISSEPFRRSDFFETGTGNCRLMSQLCIKLSGTSPVWRKLVAPWAEYLAQTLWTNSKTNHGRNFVLPTRLTQQRRMEAKSKTWVPTVKLSKHEHVCKGCGKGIAKASDRCLQCSVSNSTERLVEVSHLGRIAGHTPLALAKEGKTQRRHALARSSWRAEGKPAWLTEEFYANEVQPRLLEVSGCAIAKEINVSNWYGGKIRLGYVPHPMHWEKLAEMVEVSGAASSNLKHP